mgnify:CR=1 FL=1
MAWKKEIITNDIGEEVQAQAPVIISASRATDIPAYYAEWFFNRLEKGYSAWVNPFSGQKSYVSYSNTRLIVFWSKNPGPLLPYLDILKEKGINRYIQFTINDYEDEQLEKNVPPLDERIETFRELTEKLGKGKVLWRFDPLVLGGGITTDILLRKVEYVGDRLYGYADKLVMGFLNVASYKKVQKNLAPFEYRELTEEEKHLVASGISGLNSKWGYELGMCSQTGDFERYGIVPNRCIDDKLIIKHFSHDAALMEHLGVKVAGPDLFGAGPGLIIPQVKKDPGQRQVCGCIASKDIGQYNTCIHKCEYCYANISTGKADSNYNAHIHNPGSETIIGG